MVQLTDRPSAPAAPATLSGETPTGLTRIPWYPVLFLVLVGAGFLLRIHRLGERSIHHDESLHALYSWYIYVGRGYVHDPMMHGPWQFDWTALIYFLFGDSDFTARLAPALFGTALIALPYFLRHELGRTGALVASVLLTISPAFLYFSRFAREDIYFATWNALIAVAFFGMIRTHQERYLYLAALALAGAFATKEAIYISAFIWVSFFLVMITLFGRTEAGRAVASTIRAYSLGSYARAVGLTLAVDALLFTTFLTNMGEPARCLQELRELASSRFERLPRRCGGLWTGTVGALLYWFQQHDVQRGGQPWFYYLMLVPLYEFVPLVLASFSLLWRHTRRSLFFWFCLWWAAFAMLIYSYAGEKMPWITPHIVLPLIFLGGQLLGDWIDRIDLGRLKQPASLAVIVLGLTVFALSAAALGISAVRALTPLERQSFMLERLSFVVAILAVLAAIVWISRRRREALIGVPLCCAGLLWLGTWYVHTAWQLSYKNGDVPVEMLVYVQSSPDVPLVVQEIERIGFQTGQGKELKILMDNGYTETVGRQNVVHEAISWPFEWYLREYKNRKYYSRVFGSDINLADYPVALIMAPNLDPVRDRMGDYNGQRYRLNWWYPEDYKGLSWKVIQEGLSDSSNRARLLQYLLNREVVNPLGAREFFFFARKEIPPLGPAPSALSARPAVTALMSAVRVATLISRPDGSAIYGRGQDGATLLSQPKGVAVGPDGKLYVAEAAAHRVTVFNRDGTIAATWGRQGNGDGEFAEPWGVTVGPNGDVFVADTWNHRIQRFDSTGKLLKKWGTLADARGRATDQTGRFWGPRDVKLGPDGLVYVSDTGNKRIQVFDEDGKFIRAFGGEGSEPGRLREPVGLAFDGNSLLVADSWNNRIQRLDLNGQPIGQIAVPGWDAQTLTNKPYLTVDGGGRVLATSPDRGVVHVFAPDGSTAPPLLLDPSAASTGPTGIALSAQGELYTSDSRNGVVYRLSAGR